MFHRHLSLPAKAMQKRDLGGKIQSENGCNLGGHEVWNGQFTTWMLMFRCCFFEESGTCVFFVYANNLKFWNPWTLNFVDGKWHGKKEPKCQAQESGYRRRDTTWTPLWWYVLSSQCYEVFLWVKWMLNVPMTCVISWWKVGVPKRILIWKQSTLLFPCDVEFDFSNFAGVLAGSSWLLPLLLPTDSKKPNASQKRPASVDSIGPSGEIWSSDDIERYLKANDCNGMLLPSDNMSSSDGIWKPQ